MTQSLTSGRIFIKCVHLHWVHKYSIPRGLSQLFFLHPQQNANSILAQSLSDCSGKSFATFQRNIQKSKRNVIFLEQQNSLCKHSSQACHLVKCKDFSIVWIMLRTGPLLYFCNSHKNYLIFVYVHTLFISYKHVNTHWKDLFQNVQWNDKIYLIYWK